MLHLSLELSHIARAVSGPRAAEVANGGLRVKRVFADRARVVRLSGEYTGSLHLSHLVLVAEKSGHQKAGGHLGYLAVLITQTHVLLRAELGDGC